MNKLAARRDSRGGFTLIEALVVVAIIALLVAIILPSLRNAREQAKEVTCGAYLNNFGRGFFAYAAGNRDYLCSGSFDPGKNPIGSPLDPRLNPKPTIPTSDDRDGPVQKIGWVADLVNSKSGFPGRMLCPSNPSHINQKLGTGTSSGAYIAVQADLLIGLGYNTNYTQSWYMARTECKAPFAAPKKVSGTLGPLKTAKMSKVSASRVPLLGDSSLESSDSLHGLPTIRTMTNGPFNGTYDNQDYQDFGPQHGYGKAITVTTGATKTTTEHNRANILMGDGHIERFIDQDINGSRDGRFTCHTDPNTGMAVQDDVQPARVFDGVLTLGRQNGGSDPFMMN